MEVRKNPPSLKIDIAAEIPKEYFNNNPVLDKKHLKEDIKNRLEIKVVYIRIHQARRHKLTDYKMYLYLVLFFGIIYFILKGGEKYKSKFNTAK